MVYIGEYPKNPNTQGWEQFNASKSAMLSAFDQAIVRSKGRKVQTEHGKVAEAEFRKWLSDFLPKKYGVTSGFIISQGLGEAATTPHFDVIIYDILESPVLWIEENPDSSMNGQSRAIPAEYVKAVFEVKSRFNAQNVKNAINHIGELEILLSGQNPDPDGYNLFLPKDFFWSLVFFDFKIGDRGKLSSLNNFLDGLKFRGIAPSVILRYEGFENEVLTGSVELFLNKQKDEAIADVSSSQFEFNDLNASFVLCFTEENFSRFAFSTLRLLNPNLGYSNYVRGSSNSEFV